MADKTSYTGVKVLENVPPEVITEAYKGVVPVDALDQRYKYYPHMFIVLKSPGSESALCKVNSAGDGLSALQNGIKACDVVPKNKEQRMALSALMDESIPVNVMTGKAGTGKTLLALATALHKIEQKKYQRLIMTKPMSQVGEDRLGFLPGDVDDKFHPYLINYMSNLEHIVGQKAVQHAIEQYRIEFIPIQLMRGASFYNSFIIADETQVMNHHQMLTLGTRLGEHSKIVILGDLNQRDSDIKKEKTGIWELTNSETCKQSGLVSSIELIKVVRSEVSALFSKTFEE